MWEVILATGLSTGIVSFIQWLRSSRVRAWQEAAQSCGLKVAAPSRFWSSYPRIYAQAESLSVWIQQSQKTPFDCLIGVAIPDAPDFSSIRIGRQELKPAGVPEIAIGDEPFDNTFYISGPARLLFALLEEETRHLLIRLNAESRMLEIGGGALRVGTSDRGVAVLLPLLLDIGRRFARSLDALQRLTGNQDADAGMLLNLLLLRRELPAGPGTTEALRAACADPIPQVRLRAAQALGTEGHAVLAELAESPIDDIVSAQAVSILGPDLPLERARAILVQALRRRHVQTARACLQVLGGSTAAEDVDTLEKVLEREKGELAACAATALGTTGSRAAEEPLIHALQRSELADLQAAAANALAHAGTAAAVLPLKELAEHAHHPEVRKAARQAILEIQSRVSGASPGQLSLAATEAGQLSLAQIEAGELSLTDNSDGRLSLSDSEES